MLRIQTPLRIAVAVIVAAVALPGASCGGSQAAFSQEKIDAMQAAVEGVMARKGVPGVVVGVWQPGEGVWAAALGQADLATGTPLRVEDRFRVASVTKTFTATVVLELYDDGRLSLEDPISQYVEGIPGGEGITLRRLLDHTSGLHEYTDDPVFLQASAADPYREWRPREMVDIAVANPPYFAPGGGFHYTNTNYVLLGMVVEAVTGRGFADELEAGVLEPLGLEDTYLPEGNKIEGRHASGYWDFNGDGTLDDFTGLVNPTSIWAAGALVSDLDDLKRWSAALADGELLEPETQRERLTFVETDTPELAWVKYGLGIMEHQGMLGHDGGMPGYNSCMFRSPADGATIIVLVNMFTSTWDNTADQIFRELEALLYP